MCWGYQTAFAIWGAVFHVHSYSGCPVGLGSRRETRPMGEGVARENSPHFATPPLVSQRNDVWEISTEIPCWWRVSTQMQVLLLIGWSKFPTRYDQSETTQIWVVIRHQYGISAPVSQTSFRGETSGGIGKCRLFSQASEGAEKTIVCEQALFFRAFPSTPRPLRACLLKDHQKQRYLISFRLNTPILS